MLISLAKHVTMFVVV